MSLTVDPNDIQAVITAQHEWLEKLQEADPTHPIKIKIMEGETPEGKDYDLYAWVDFKKIWHKVTAPIYTRGIMLNEILIDPDSENWQDVREGIGKLHSFCEENNIPHLMGFSGGKGIHFSVIFGAITAGDPESSKALFEEVGKYNIDAFKTVRRALLFEIARRAGVNLEKIGIDKKKINFRVTRMGSQVREFGTIRSPGKYKTLVTEIPDKKPEPNELPLVFPDEVEIWNILDTEYNEIAIDALEKEIDKAKNADDYTSISDENFKDIPIIKFPCIEKLFKAGIRNGRYYANVAVVLICQKCGISKEETKKHLIVLSKTFPGISQADADLRIHNALEMYGKDYRFSCVEIKETFPEYNLCNFVECPLKKKLEEEKKKEESERITNLLNEIEPSADDETKLKQAKTFIRENLMGRREDEAEEYIIKVCKHFVIKGNLKTNVNKFYRLEKKELVDKKKKYNESEEDEELKLPFDVIAERVMRKIPLFAMRDTEEFYIYENGVYRNNGSKLRLSRLIRDEYKEYFLQQWYSLYPNTEPEEIPAAKAKYVAEVMEYIRAYKNADREEIDREQDRYINFKNGLFDLEEWKLKEHTPEILSVAQARAVYDPEAKCPKISRYFEECQLHKDSITVLEEFAGYCLTADVKLQKALMLYGKGANGKSVFINLLKTILGKDYVSGESLHRLETDKYRVANLYGKRLNAFPDLKDTPLQTNEVFNTLVGGDKQLTGERKYQNSFDFDPTTKLLFSANKIPFAYSDNYAYYRRWILIEFPRTFEKDEIDESLLEKLTTEAEKSGFLNLMLAGLKRLFDNMKFSYDPGVEEIEKQYLLHSDNVQVFEETCLRDCEGTESPNSKKDVYDFYLLWCRFRKLTPAKPKTFTKKLEKIGRKVYNTTVYNAETGKGDWFSCYHNTRLTVNVNLPKNNEQNLIQTHIDAELEELLKQL